MIGYQSRLPDEKEQTATGVSFLRIKRCSFLQRRAAAYRRLSFRFMRGDGGGFEEPDVHDQSSSQQPQKEIRIDSCLPQLTFTRELPTLLSMKEVAGER